MPFVLAALAVTLPASAQLERAYIMQTTPYPVYSTPETSAYNIKWKRMIARFNAAYQIEFNDNIDLVEQNKTSDISMGPTINVGFLLPTTKNNLLQLDMGAGYRWYMKSSSVNTFTLAPKSRLDYRMFLGNLHLDVFDTFSVQADPVQRPEISGGPSRLTHFRRFANTCGVIGEWRPYRRWGLLGGYSFTLDRSLTSDFLDMDYDMHTWTAGTFYQASSKLTLGVNGSYSILGYRDSLQNDGHTFTVGPFASYELSRFVMLDAACGWTYSSYENRGLIADFSDFEGFTCQFGMRHRINSWSSQNVRAGRTVGLGYGSNFTESWMVQHGFTTRLNRATTLNTLFSWQSYNSSIAGGDSGVRYLIYAGIAYQLTRRWHTSLGYSFAWKDSDLPGRDYTQNRLALDVSRQF